MVVSGVMYNQRVLPICCPVKKKRKRNKAHQAKGHLPGCDDRDVRRTLRAAPRAYILKVRTKITFREPRLSKAHSLSTTTLARQQKQPKQTRRFLAPRQLTFACARALISAEAFITSTSHALFTLRNAPTSGASELRFDLDAVITSR